MLAHLNISSLEIALDAASVATTPRSTSLSTTDSELVT